VIPIYLILLTQAQGNASPSATALQAGAQGRPLLSTSKARGKAASHLATMLMRNPAGVLAGHAAKHTLNTPVGPCCIAHTSCPMTQPDCLHAYTHARAPLLRCSHARLPRLPKAHSQSRLWHQGTAAPTPPWNSWNKAWQGSKGRLLLVGAVLTCMRTWSAGTDKTKLGGEHACVVRGDEGGGGGPSTIATRCPHARQRSAPQCHCCMQPATPCTPSWLILAPPCLMRSAH